MGTTCVAPEVSALGIGLHAWAPSLLFQNICVPIATVLPSWCSILDFKSKHGLHPLRFVQPGQPKILISDTKLRCHIKTKNKQTKNPQNLV